MAKLKRAKRANRPNPREDRNYNKNFDDRNSDNIITLDNFRNRQRKIELLPRNVAQENYIECLENDNINIVFGIGLAGTGKTHVAALCAVKALLEKKVERIVITRPAVCTDENIGHLPGRIEDKLFPWLLPILDCFRLYYTADQITKMFETQVIEIAPFAFMRGRSFSNVFLIADEMQNSTANQMKMLLTRIGEGSKMVITGDMTQADKNFHNNGLKDFITRFDKFQPKGIAVVRFYQKDVVRHPIIDAVLNLYGDDIL
jgi:phosphate starvation-inducible PhoH-like protein